MTSQSRSRARGSRTRTLGRSGPKRKTVSRARRTSVRPPPSCSSSDSRAFPGDRAMTVNLAYLQSLASTTDELDAGAFSDGLAAAVAGLESYVDATPTDATAALLLANLALLTDPANGLARATAIAGALTDDPSTEAAGRVVRADALLSAADRDRTRSPFLARSEALRALADYDRVIELTGDPAAYAGRARTLDVLGSRDAAIEAQREAVRLAPASSVWRLWLAQLESCSDQAGAWRRAAEDALATAAATKAAADGRDTELPAARVRHRLRQVLDRQRHAGMGRQDRRGRGGRRREHLIAGPIPAAASVHLRDADRDERRRTCIDGSRTGGPRRGGPAGGPDCSRAVVRGPGRRGRRGRRGDRRRRPRGRRRDVRRGHGPGPPRGRRAVRGRPIDRRIHAGRTPAAVRGGGTDLRQRWRSCRG